MSRRPYQLVLALALLSIISGYLLAHASWVGRTGIKWFYQEYGFLNTWWQAAMAVFGVWVLFYALQSLVQKLAKPAIARMVHIVAIVTALVGLYLSYDDFRNTLSHRMMGERFHLGVYLFWIGWVLISAYLLVGRKPVIASDKKEITGV